MNDRGRLTRRGQVLAGAAVVMALAGFLFGVLELYCLAAAEALLVVVARAWVSTRRCDLDVTRHVHPARVPAGQEARVELAVGNSGPRPTPPVEAADPFDGGRRWARFAIAPVRPGELRRSSYRLPSTRRGVYHLGPLELRVFDPFGLAVRTRTTAVDTSLTVYPRFELVPARAASSHRSDGTRRPQPVLGRGSEDFHTLREYVAGDDLRQVHWPSTARLDDLIIKQSESLQRGRLTVAADLRSTVHDDDTLEAVISAAAGVAVSSLHEGLQVRVVTTGGFDSGHGEGRGQAPAILDGLAAAEAHRPAPGVAPFRVAGGSDPVVLITTDRVSDADLESVYSLGGATGTTVVVFDTGRGGAADGGPGSGGPAVGGPAVGGPAGGGARRLAQSRRTVRVPVGGSFAAAWKTWEKASC